MSDVKKFSGLKKFISESVNFLEWLQENMADDELHNDIHILMMRDEVLAPLDFEINSSQLNQIKTFLELQDYNIIDGIEFIQLSQDLIKSFSNFIDGLITTEISESYIHGYLGALFHIYVSKTSKYTPSVIRGILFIQAIIDNEDDLAYDYSSRSTLPVSTYKNIGKFLIVLFLSPNSAWAKIGPFLEAVFISPLQTLENILIFYKRYLLSLSQNNTFPIIQDSHSQVFSAIFGDANTLGKFIEYTMNLENFSPLKLTTTANGGMNFQKEWNNDLLSNFNLSVRDLSFIIDQSATTPIRFSMSDFLAQVGIVHSSGSELNLNFSKADSQTLKLAVDGIISYSKKWKNNWNTEFRVEANNFIANLSSGNAIGGITTQGGNFIFNAKHKRDTIPADQQSLDTVSGSRFESGPMEFQFQLSNNEIKLFTSLKECRLIIDPSNGDGFISSIIPIEKNINFDLSCELGYNKSSEFYFKGDIGQEIRIALRESFGPLSFQDISIKWNLGNQEQNGLVAEIVTSFTLSLGPFDAAIEQIGFKLGVSFPESDPVDLTLGFKPPTGIGLSLDASIVKGGGYLFFDSEKEQYGGALEIVIAKKISVVAIALITTRFPDGSKGFSLLLLISVEFSPVIALGMGFFLSGIGGMIGINRTVNTDALREGVKQGSVDHILFPTDVVANIQRIITDLREFFPPQRDQFIIGLMAKITWGVPTLLSVEFGIAIEFTNPVRLAILGVIKLVLPTEDAAILKIQVNFIGVIDFNEGYLMFDASLFGSKILTFTLEGDMALRIFWGKEKEFLLSVGGFHPAYSPPAFLKVGSMTRLTLNILSGNPSLTLTTYFAITSNTVQFGAQIDFYFKISKFKVIGYFGFDVLFQFSPFHFIASIRAGVEVKLGSRTLFSISLAFNLEGPTPWIANGTATFKILFIKIKVNFSKTWGERREDILPGILVLPKLIAALEQPRNWVGDLPSNKFLLTSMKKLELMEGQVIMHGVGTLTIRQTILPLAMEISKFGNFVPSDIRSAYISNLSIDSVASAFVEVKDAFAPAEFKEMEDNDKLKAPSYKEEVSGVKITSTERLHLNYGINRIVNYEIGFSDYHRESEQPYVLYNPVKKIAMPDKLSLFKKMALGGAIAKNELSKELKVNKFRNERAVKIQTEKFVITNMSDLTKMDMGGFQNGTKAEADDILKKAIRNNPSLKDKIQVIPEYELM
jgi:hypothetical protein